MEYDGHISEQSVLRVDTCYFIPNSPLAAIMLNLQPSLTPLIPTPPHKRGLQKVHKASAMAY